MQKQEILEKIMKKKEFSKLPKKDVLLAFSKFEKRQVSEMEKIRLTRDLLNKIYWGFRSTKLLSPKDKDFKWILQKHLSTRERLPYYEEVYSKLLKNISFCTIFDLGCGANAFSFPYLVKVSNNLKYIGVEAVEQLADLSNSYFKKFCFDGKVYSFSLFELIKLKKIIKKEKGEKIIFLFKVLDSLEMLERNYSKKLLLSLTSLVDKVVVSFSTQSMLKREKFKANRKWLLSFIENNFEILDLFEKGGEKYIIFKKQ